MTCTCNSKGMKVERTRLQFQFSILGRCTTCHFGGGLLFVCKVRSLPPEFVPLARDKKSIGNICTCKGIGGSATPSGFCFGGSPRHEMTCTCNSKGVKVASGGRPKHSARVSGRRMETGPKTKAATQNDTLRRPQTNLSLLGFPM